MKIITLFFSLMLLCSIALASQFGAPVTGTAGASTKVLNANNLRTYLIIENTGATPIIVKFNSAISGSDEGLLIPAGGNYEPNEAPAGAVYLKAQSGSPTYVVIEGN